MGSEKKSALIMSESMRKLVDDLHEDKATKKYIYSFGQTVIVVCIELEEESVFKHIFLPVVPVNKKNYAINIPLFVMECNYVIGDINMAIEDLLSIVDIEVSTSGPYINTLLSVNGKKVAGCVYNHITRDIALKRVGTNPVSACAFTGSKIPSKAKIESGDPIIIAAAEV